MEISSFWTFGFLVFHYTSSCLHLSNSLTSDVNNNKCLIELWIQKRRGNFNSPLIPVFRLSHCLIIRISNTVSPRRDICIRHFTPLTTKVWNGYNTPNMDVPVAYLSMMIQICEIWRPKDNVRKRPFQYALHSSIHGNSPRSPPLLYAISSNKTNPPALVN